VAEQKLSEMNIEGKETLRISFIKDVQYNNNKYNYFGAVCFMTQDGERLTP
jgi:hypothetical protein